MRGDPRLTGHAVLSGGEGAHVRLPGMAYALRSVNGTTAEICDECGFNGTLLSPADVSARFARLADDWDRVMEADEALARERPEPARWCAVEYCAHTIHVLRFVEWAARRFVAGEPAPFDVTPPDVLSDQPGPMDEHDCGVFDMRERLSGLRSVATAIAEWMPALRADELGRENLYVGTFRFDTLTVLRHGLHDAEHHLLDIRRGVAKQLLATTPAAGEP